MHIAPRCVVAATTLCLVAGLIGLAPSALAMSSSIVSTSVGRAPEAVLAPTGSTKVLVANSSANTLSVVDRQNMGVTATLTGFGEPRALVQVPSQVGTFAAVLDSFPAAIRIVNVSTGLVTDTIPIPGAVLPTDMAVAGSRWYVADPSAHAIHVYDADTGTFGTDFAVSGNPTRVAASADGLTLYVVASAYLYAVDASNGAVDGTATSSGIYTSVRDIGGAVYATVDAGVVEKYAAVTLAPKATFPDSGILRAIAPAFDGSFAYVANETGSTIDLMRLSDGVVLDRAPLPSSPSALSSSPGDMNVAYAVSTTGDTVSQATFIPSRPSSPTITSVTCRLRHGTVTVRAHWTPPADAGDLGISGYQMKSHKVRDSHWSRVRRVPASATTATNKLTRMRAGDRVQVQLITLTMGGAGSFAGRTCRVR